MRRKKLAIVSSYNTKCANASYTHVLKEEFGKYYDVEILPVNFNLLGDFHPRARAAARQYIEGLTARLRDFDYVNIQFEAGLYGYSMIAACKNVLPLIRASRRLIFTVHRVHVPALRPWWKIILMNGRHFIQTLKEFRQGQHYKAFATIMRALHAREKSGNLAAVIVHTQRERDLVRLYYDIEAVVDYPITFLNRRQIAEHIHNRERIRAEIFRDYELDPESTYIGIFGFLSENKGHHVAIEALRFLPPRYKLAIFGGQHPMAIKDYDLNRLLKQPKLFGRNSSTYISSLVDLAKSFLLRDGKRETCLKKQRVRFLGTTDDAGFIRAIAAMDFVVLPYMETGQGGSANASLMLELQSNVIFSRTFAFMELERYYPECFVMVDIGNPLQLAQAIGSWRHDFSTAQHRALACYNIEHNVLIHKEAFEDGAARARELKRQLIEKPIVEDPQSLRFLAARHYIA